MHYKSRETRTRRIRSDSLGLLTGPGLIFGKNLRVRERVGWLTDRHRPRGSSSPVPSGRCRDGGLLKILNVVEDAREYS